MSFCENCNKIIFMSLVYSISVILNKYKFWVDDKQMKKLLGLFTDIRQVVENLSESLILWFYINCQKSLSELKQFIAKIPQGSVLG